MYMDSIDHCLVMDEAAALVIPHVVAVRHHRVPLPESRFVPQLMGLKRRVEGVYMS